MDLGTTPFPAAPLSRKTYGPGANFETPDVDTAVDDARKSGAALVENERRVEIVWVEVGIAGVDRGAAGEQGVGPGRADIVLERTEQRGDGILGGADPSVESKPLAASPMPIRLYPDEARLPCRLTQGGLPATIVFAVQHAVEIPHSYQY